jgi:hypothetical protein
VCPDVRLGIAERAVSCVPSLWRRESGEDDIVRLENEVSVAELLRVMVGLELEPSNPYSAAAYLRMAGVQEVELERRARVRVA